MSGTQISARPKHPEGKKLSEALAEDADALKARKGLIDKTATLIKAPDDESDAFGDLGATMRPTDAQLAVINGFTRKVVTADEVVAFSTLSCNDIIDRDDDQFTTQCVKDFAALAQPFSPVGKSFMLDHVYSVHNAVGRIFGVDTKKVSGATFLTNEVYMPNTEQFAPLIEKIDFGISWAVSVGVMLGKDECSLPWCDARFSSWGWWCQNGHDKGLFYLKDGEEDSWGYPAPVPADTKGAKKCVREFSEPRDMYELSQVFLGAQYFAALEKEPAYAAVMKAAGASKVPIIGLSAEEAKDLPMRHEPKKLSEARRSAFKIEEAEDGSLVWCDAEGLRWTFDPENPDDGVLSLGKATNDEEEGDDDGEHEVPSGPGSAGPGEVDGNEAPVADAGSGDGGSGSGSDPGSADGDQQGSQSGASVADKDADPDDTSSDDEEEEDDPEGSDSSSSDDEDEEKNPDDDPDDTTDEGEEKSVSKKAVIEAAEKAKLPQDLIDVAKGHSGNGLQALLTAAAKQIKSLIPKAELGEQAVKDARADAIDWYVKAHATKEVPKVSTTTFEKLLDKCGDDLELLRNLSDQNKEMAQAKFPKSVKRSSFPTDPHDVTKAPDVDFGDDDDVKGGDDNDQRVKRIHG